VLATNRTETVRDFVRMAFKAVDIELDFRGTGVDEQGVDAKSARRWFGSIQVLPAGGGGPADRQSAKAKAKLGWEPARHSKNCAG